MTKPLQLLRTHQVLSRLAQQSGEHLLDAWLPMLHTAADALDLHMAGIWRFDAAQDAIRSVCRIARGQPAPLPELVLAVADVPDYVRALRRGEPVVVPHIPEHPDTQSLVAYGAAHGVGALLDIPLFRNGELFGLVCFEAGPGPRLWTDEEALFAQSVAEMLLRQQEWHECKRLVHELQQREQTVQQQYAWLKSLIDSSDSYVLIVDRDFRIRFANGALYRDFSDLDVTIETQMLVRRLVPRETWAFWTERLTRSLQGERLHFSVHAHFEGHPERYYDVLLTPLRNHEQQPEGVIMYLHDVTSLKQQSRALAEANEELESQQEELRQNMEALAEAERHLREERQRMRAVADNVPGVIFEGYLSRDMTGEFAYVSRGSELLFGVPPERIMDDPGWYRDTLHPDELPERVQRWDELHARALREGSFQVATEARRVVDGRTIWVRQASTVALAPDGARLRVVGVSFDIGQVKAYEQEIEAKNQELVMQQEELRQALDHLMATQAQLVQNEKMAALGQLTAGIAHEINNPLNFVHNGVAVLNDYVPKLLQLLEDYLAVHAMPPHEQAAHLSQVSQVSADAHLLTVREKLPGLLSNIAMGAERVTRIVRGLKSFSRLDQEQAIAADIHLGIEDTLLLLQARLHHIRVQRAYGQLPPITCYPSQLNQVFMNLLTNAIDAIEAHPPVANGGGCIGIETLALDDRVVVRVRDNGCGLAPGTETRIYDPFFTTKTVGNGTGLGLSISYGIVQNHGGLLKAFGNPDGGGTTFQLELPIHHGEALPAAVPG